MIEVLHFGHNCRSESISLGWPDYYIVLYGSTDEKESSDISNH